MTIHVDLETTGLDPRVDDVRVVSIDGRVYDVWDDTERRKAIDELEDRCEEEFVAHNAQFDLDFIQEHLGIEWKGKVFDTQVAFQILENGRDNSAKLSNVAKLLLQKDMDKTLQKSGWNGSFLFADAKKYASEDTLVLKPIRDKLKAGLKKARLNGIMNLEMELLPILVKARRTGIFFDVEGARKLQSELEKKAVAIEKTLPRGLHPRSPQNVAKYFNLQDSSEDTLRAGSESRPVLRKVVEVRKLLKKRSTIEKQLIGYVRYDSRIHPSFTQCFTETGRLSCNSPNLQNQDRGPDIRGLFIPQGGCKFVIADYSSLEVRIAAVLAKEDKMLEVLREGRDLHSETCARIFGEETKQTRTLSKNILFGSLFGGGPGTVVRFAAKSDVNISESEARSFQKALFDAYPKLKAWHKKAGNTNKSFVYSIQGRRRYIEKGEGYNTRINHTVQSSAADGQKLAMILLAKKGLLPIVNVHDELIVEVPAERAEQALGEVENTMVESMYRALNLSVDNPTVPIKVEGKVADSWAEKA